MSAIAFAHTDIQSSLPSNGAIMKRAPEAIELYFGGVVQLIKIELKAANGESVNLTLPKEPELTKHFRIPLPDLKVSAYKVNWVSAGSDGHKIKGKFGFKYVGNNEVAGRIPNDDQEITTSNISAWVVGIVVNKLLIYIALAMTVGGLAAMFTLTHYKDRQIPFINYLPLGCLLGLVTVSLGFLLQVGSFAEEGITGMWNKDFAEILWNSGVGKSYKLQIIGWLLISLMIFMMWLKPAFTHLFSVLSLIGTLIISASFTLSGHTTEAPLWVRVALAFHVSAAMWWLGSLYPLRCACNVLAISNLQLLMIDFGKQAMFLVCLLVAGGIGISYHLEGSFSNLLQTGHGNLLLLKLVIVAIIVFIAAMHKFRYVSTLNTEESIKVLQRSITKEMWVGFSILLLTAVLSSVSGPVHN